MTACLSSCLHPASESDPDPMSPPESPPSIRTNRTIALVGLMGVGKSTVGRRLAHRLGLPFADSDDEIEAAAGMTISEIFATMGEAEFRAGEARVIRRLLEARPMVLATGGGAILNDETRALLKSRALTVWMKADLGVVAERVGRRDTRPLLKGRDPLEALTALAEARYPLYAEADVTVEVGRCSHQTSVEDILRVLEALEREQAASPDGGPGQDENR